MTAMRQSEGREVAELYVRARRAIPATVSGIVGRSDAEDILHDAFVAFLAQPGWIRTPEAWLGRVARNRAISLARKVRTVDLADHADTKDEHRAVESSAIDHLMRASLGKLKDRDRRALELRYVSCAPYEQIAGELHLSVPQAHVVVHRAVRKLGREVVRAVAEAYGAHACISKLERLTGLRADEHVAEPCAMCKEAWSDLSMLRRVQALLPFMMVRRVFTKSHLAATGAAGVLLAVSLGGFGVQHAPRATLPIPVKKAGTSHAHVRTQRITPPAALQRRAGVPNSERAPLEKTVNGGPVGVGEDTTRVDVARGSPGGTGVIVCGPVKECS